MQCTVYIKQVIVHSLWYRAHCAQLEQGIGLNLQPADFITVASNLTTASWAEDDDDCDDDVNNDDDCDEDSTDNDAALPSSIQISHW